jgi:topoisomerase IA-like protein
MDSDKVLYMVVQVGMLTCKGKKYRQGTKIGRDDKNFTLLLENGKVSDSLEESPNLLAVSEAEAAKLPAEKAPAKKKAAVKAPVKKERVEKSSESPVIKVEAERTPKE